MRAVNEGGRCLHGAAAVDGEPSAHELMNEATEWLQYARGVTVLLADLVHEADAVDCQQISLALEAIGAMTHAGLQRVGQAHERWHWQVATHSNV
ncbi:MAG: hypothetical protein WBW32_04720 [Luteibacter sp.]